MLVNTVWEDRFLAAPAAGPVPSAPGKWSWEALMREALVLAAKAQETGEVPVGALVVSPDGRIVGRGYNTPVQGCDPTAHAEVNALRDAARTTGNYRLDGCILVVTLEPCTMCAGACVHARVSGVVFGSEDRVAGAVVSRGNVLDEACSGRSVWHMGGVLASSCASMLRDFFAERR